MKLIKRIIGKTVLGQEIESWNASDIFNAPNILILGGVHGDESEGIEIAEYLIEHLNKSEVKINISIIPCLNKDGQTHNLRSNYNDVDLNRNLPTLNWAAEFKNPRYKPGSKAASEPETRAFIDHLNHFKPDLIISLHSFSESLILYAPGNGKYNHKVEKLALNLSLKLVPKMSYDVTGSLNTLALERNIPAITIEAPRDESWNKVKNNFYREIVDFLSFL